MAEATTHIIEIATGIGEPAFIPLCLGQELQPISVGKRGMWRIESPRVLDVHAFVYFDGQSLFLQSADEENAAIADGVAVGKAWTELHAPCKIEIGLARLRFRALLRDHDGPAESPEPPTVAELERGSLRGLVPQPGASMPVAGAVPPPAGSHPPLVGDFGDSTRVSPFEYDPNPPPRRHDPNLPAHPPQPAAGPEGTGGATPQGAQPPPPRHGGTQGVGATVTRHLTPKSIAALLFIFGGILYFATEEEAPRKRTQAASLDAGGASDASGPSSTPSLVVTPPAPPTWPAGYPCPPPNWPPKAPLPCMPLADYAAIKDGGKPAKEPKDAGPSTLPAGTKTLERQAVDLVAAGETAKAAAVYELLARRDPNNKVFADAARILRAKLDAGAP